MKLCLSTCVLLLNQQNVLILLIVHLCPPVSAGGHKWTLCTAQCAGQNVLPLLACLLTECTVTCSIVIAAMLIASVLHICKMFINTTHLHLMVSHKQREISF